MVLSLGVLLNSIVLGMVVITFSAGEGSSNIQFPLSCELPLPPCPLQKPEPCHNSYKAGVRETFKDRLG